FSLWALYPRTPQLDPSKYKFLHCPKCGREFPYAPELDGKPCSRCLPDFIALVPTAESVAQGGGLQNPFGRMLAVIIVELNILMVAVLYVESSSRRARAKAQEEQAYLYFRCIHCRRKLRFAASKAGQKGQCPRCKRNLVFENAFADEEEA